MKVRLLILLAAITPLLVYGLGDIAQGVADVVSDVAQTGADIASGAAQAGSDVVNRIDDRIHEHHYHHRGPLLGRRHAAYSSVTRYSPTATTEQLTDLYAMGRLNDADIREIELDRVIKPDSILTEVRATISRARGKQAYLINQILAGTIDIRDVRSSMDDEQYRDLKFKAREQSQSFGNKFSNMLSRPNATEKYNMDVLNNK